MSKNVSAAQVREYFRTNPKAFKALGEPAQATVKPQDEARSVRGRVHPEARTAFNKAHRSLAYVEAEAPAKSVTVKGVKVTPKTKAGISRVSTTIPFTEARETLALAGVEVGERGRLSADSIELLGAATWL